MVARWVAIMCGMIMSCSYAADAPHEYYHGQLPDEQAARKQYKEMKRQGERLEEAVGGSLTLSKMSYQQLCQRKNELIVMGEYRTAISYLKQMLKVIERPDQIIYIMLELAELFMKCQEYRKAEHMYLDFVQLYPGNQFAEQAYVKAIECSWLQVLDAERDQTKTESTLALADQFLARGKIEDSDMVHQVMEIKEKCHHLLAQHDMGIIMQRIGHRQTVAAHKCINALMGDATKVALVEPELLHARIKLAQLEGRHEAAEQLLADLRGRFPEHQATLAFAKKPLWQRWFGA